MTSNPEEVATVCPAESSEEPTLHTVLSTGGQTTVRCQDCGHVHKVRLADPGATSMTVVVSQDGESVSTTIERQATDELTVGDEFIVESDEGIFTVETTALELDDESRPEQASAEHVQTVWTRAIGNVSVPVTVHPQPGTGHRQDSYSTTLHVPGGYTVTVGDDETIEETTVTIERIRRRATEEGDGRTLDTAGKTVPAKDIDRIYARDQETVRSPW